jgi:hypothetical protein
MNTWFLELIHSPIFRKKHAILQNRSLSVYKAIGVEAFTQERPTAVGTRNFSVFRKAASTSKYEQRKSPGTSQSHKFTYVSTFRFANLVKI